MINEAFLTQIKRYNPNNILDIKNAMKEVLQEIILASLAKNDFFCYAIFYGGTSLRIFRSLPRFSEDLDFTLEKNITTVNLNKYLLKVEEDLKSFGLNCKIDSKEKKNNTSVKSYFITFNLKELFNISYSDYANKIISNELLSIKFEIENKTFDGGITETKLLTTPFFCTVKTFNMETLFASKLIAVLNRKWQTRVKGRDFYDYLFYISTKTKVNMTFLENGLKTFGYLSDNEKLTLGILKKELKEKFLTIDFDKAKEDVNSFISKNDVLIKSFKKEIFIASIDLIETE